MVNLYKLKFTKLQNEIFSLLCIRAGDSLNQREMAELLNVSPPAIAKAIPLLEKEGFIKISKEKRINLISIELNRDERKIIWMKRSKNLDQLYESGIIDFLETEFAGAVIILFGSFSKGEDISKSDIDLAVIGRKPKKVNLEKFEKILEKEIIINFYDSFKEIHKNLRANILNGITLVGSVEL